MNRVTVAAVAHIIVMFATGVSTAQTWSDTQTSGDWIGRDWSCSEGATPAPDKCNASHKGQVAVCWYNRHTGECNNAYAWCTYKTVGVNTPQNGTNAGNVYGCGLGQPTSYFSVCHGENAKKVINFNPFKDQDAHGCDDHSGWTVFEGCAGGGANPAVSGHSLCKGKPWTVAGNFPPVDGNACGYSWFTVTCWSGQ